MRVLLIDDDARLAELLDGNLRPQGVALVHAGGGQAGLAALGRVDTATGAARSAVIDALRGVHGVLDDRQRGQLADLLDRGGGWWRGFGPYR